LSSSPRPDGIWVPLSLLSSGYQGLFLRILSGRSVNLATHLHLEPRLRMCGAVSPYLSTGSTLPFFRDLLIAEDLLLCSQESPTGPYSEAFESIPRHHTLISLRSISVLFSHLRLGLKVVSSRRIFRLKFCTHFSSPRACYMAVNLFDLVTLIIIGKECKL